MAVAVDGMATPGSGFPPPAAPPPAGGAGGETTPETPELLVVIVTPLLLVELDVENAHPGQLNAESVGSTAPAVT
jgi:hypothetical protein